MRAWMAGLTLLAGCWPATHIYDARMADGLEFVPAAGMTVFPGYFQEEASIPLAWNSLAFPVSYGSRRVTGDAKLLFGFTGGLELGGRVGLLDPDGKVHLALGAHSGATVPLFGRNGSNYPNWATGQLLFTVDVGDHGSFTLGGHGGLWRFSDPLLDVGGTIGFSAGSYDMPGEVRVFLTVFRLGEGGGATLSYGFAM